MVAVTAKGLVKRYDDVVAVDGIDLEAHPGTCLGILGPNGAGKTTTIEMLEGITRPDAGEVRVLGRTWRERPRDLRERIGVQLQETKLEGKITVLESLRMFRSFYRNQRGLEEVLEIVGLSEKRDTWLDKLSGGQRQRLTLGCALVNRPEILFLDEPTTGLDPQARRRVWEIVEAFKQGGGTVLLTTHYMEEAERLADELVIFDRGKIISEGTPASIVGSLEAESIVELSGKDLNEELLRGVEGVVSVRRDGRAWVLGVMNTQAAVRGAMALGVTLDDLHTHRPTLDDVFLALTGRQLRDA